MNFWGRDSRVYGSWINWIFRSWVNWIYGSRVNWIYGSWVNWIFGSWVNWIYGSWINWVLWFWFWFNWCIIFKNDDLFLDHLLLLFYFLFRRLLVLLT